MDINEITRTIVVASTEVHKLLGPGLLENAYEMALERELVLCGFNVQRQIVLAVLYKGEKCDAGYRIDLLVEDKVIVEIKAVESLNNVHIAQVLTYLKLSKCRIGLLINFNVKRLKYGIRRLIL